MDACPVAAGATTGVPALPPGPRLPALVQTLLLRSRTPYFLAWCRRRLGDVFTVHDLVGGPQVFLADPAHIRAVFAADPDVLRAGEGNSILAPILGWRSVLLLDGAEHRERRRLMLPAFSAAQVRRQEDLLREVVAAGLAGWPVDRPFRCRRHAQDIALEIILRVMLGVREPVRSARLRAELPRIVEVSPFDLLATSFPALPTGGRRRRYVAHRERVLSLLDDEIALRRDDPALDERDDVLSSLVRAYAAAGRPTGDGDLRDQLLTLLVAGHETTATALAWTLELLSRDEDARRELAASVTAGSSAYSSAVVNEALRLRPVISLVARRLHAPVAVGEHVVPAGATLCPAIALVHADPAVHPEAARFRPGRWLDGDPGLTLPFGGGNRRCLGAPFAVAELRVAVEEIARRFDVLPVGRRPERSRMRHITAVPARGARIRLRPR
ncbi:MAG TPA: cytochrome P450 [Pseudonocardiaceae bacterium]